MSEGRITIDGGFTNEYFIKDHLGNTRAVVSQEGELLETDNYYPFGMQIQALSFTKTDPQNKYLYNGKELQDDFCLDWYEYGARMYDAVIARFPSLDPKVDEFAYVSPYNYAENEPVAHIDLWGMQAVPFITTPAASNYVANSAEAVSEFSTKMASTTTEAATQSLQEANEVFGNKIVSGTIAMVDGGIKMVDGTVLMASGTVVVFFAGYAMFSYGAIESGLGLATTIDCIKEATGGEGKDIPTAPFEAGGFAVDEVTGNENGTFRKIGAAGDFVVSFKKMPTPAKIPKVVRNASKVTSKASGASNLYNKMKNKNENNRQGQ